MPTTGHLCEHNNHELATHLTSYAFPEGLNARDPNGPMHEVHRHAVQQPCVPRFARQAHMQLMQMVFAAVGSLPSQDFARLGQANGGEHTARGLEGHVYGVGLPIAP